jgi:hypothetical protein
MQADFPKLRRGGVDVEFCAISGNFGAVGDHLVKNTAYNLWVLDKLHGEIGGKQRLSNPCKEQQRCAGGAVGRKDIRHLLY